MRTNATFDLRKIRLADGLLELAFGGAHNLLLRHFTVHPAQRALDFPKIAEFFTEFHIAICNNNIAYCNSCQEHSSYPGLASVPRAPLCSPCSSCSVLRDDRNT